MADQDDSPRPGKERMTIRLADLTAVKNPELVGDAEWDLRLWANGLERWQSEATLRLKEGETVEIGAEVVLDIYDTTEEVTLEVKGTERDLLRPDDHAAGSAVLYRVQGFSQEPGEVVDLRGPNAHLQLRLEVSLTS